MIIEVGMDSDALNFNSLAIVSDNSCIYEIPAVLGCTEEHACNYNAEATENDGVAGKLHYCRRKRAV